MSTQVEEKSHAELGPSGWGTWSNCPGSIALSRGIPNVSSSYAREGTAAHALLEDCLRDGFDPEDLLGREYVVEGETYIVDMDMASAVATAIGWVHEHIDPARGDILLLEQTVPIGQLTGEQDATGTSDIVGIVDGGKTLVVLDYKHGKGVQVYATDKPVEQGNDLHFPPNGQLAMYALGTYHMLGLIYDEIETVRIGIMQPRIGDGWIDTHDMPLADLLAFGDTITEAAGRVMLNLQVFAEGNELDLVPGDKQCKFCNAKAICPALGAYASTALAPLSTADDFDDLTLPKKAASLAVNPDVDGSRLAEVMRAAPLIEEMLKSVRAEVERRLLDGQPVPGFKIVEGKRGNRQWSDEEFALQELTKSGRLKMAEALQRKPISPTQAEKMLKDRPKIWAKIAPCITQSEGKPSVAPESDPRPTYQIASAPDDFEDLTAKAIEFDPFS